MVSRIGVAPGGQEVLDAWADRANSGRGIGSSVDLDGSAAVGDLAGLLAVGPKDSADANIIAVVFVNSARLYVADDGLRKAVFIVAVDRSNERTTSTRSTPALAVPASALSVVMLHAALVSRPGRLLEQVQVSSWMLRPLPTSMGVLELELPLATYAGTVL